MRPQHLSANLSLAHWSLFVRVRLCYLLLFASTMLGHGAVMQTVHGHVPAAAKSLPQIGPLAATNRLNLAISLPLRNTMVLSNLLSQIYNPASPSYHHYLTPAQFTERFGPTEKDYQTLVTFAKNKGLQVTATHSNRIILDVSGSVAVVEKALNVSFHTYHHPKENRTFFAPDMEPSLDLSVPVLHISGLDNYALPHPRLQLPKLTAKSKAVANAGSGPSGSYMGMDFRTAYVPDTMLDGTGQTVGLLQFDGYTASDITYYEDKAGLPHVPLQNVLIDGATGNPSLTGGEIEVSLDIEMAVAMATNLSKVIVYMAPNPSPFVDLLSRMANDNSAKQLSCSWYVPSGAAEPAADVIFQQMAAQGQSFFNASGDSDACTGLIDFPGDTPYITQVGGTTLTTGSGGAWASETVWNWGIEYGRDGIGSGGGISTQYPIPSWQTNISMTANQGSITKRNIPDVAMTADHIYVRANGADYTGVAGTSCAAPLWAGFAALINQQAVGSGQATIGFINPTLDQIGTGANYTAAFHDITSGNNTWSGSPTKFYAVTGYDLCTGWGTPAGQNLINALASPEKLVVTPTAGFASIGGVGGPFTVTAQTFALTNIGTNALTWTLSNTSAWLNVSATGGMLNPGSSAVNVTVNLNNTASNLVVGSYSATLWFTNLNDSVGQSRQFTLSIISPPTMTQQPANQSVLDGTAAVFTVEATGGLPLAYQWQCNGTNLTDGGAILGSSTTNLTIANVSTNNVGVYTVVVTNLAGVTVSSNALLNLTPSVPVITRQPASLVAVSGTTASFSVAAVGSKPFLYQWSFNNTNLNGATNATLTLSNVQLANAGDYSVTISNSYGGIASSNAVLNVVNVPIITAVNPVNGVVGATVTISGANFDPVAGNNTVYFGAVKAVVTAASGTNLVVTVPAGATYAPVTETVNGLTAYSAQMFLPTFAGDGSPINATSFSAQQTMAAGNNAYRVVIADMDGDGKPDLVAVNGGDNTISIFRNISTNGILTASSFAAPITLAGPTGSLLMTVADVDGDGKLDIVVSGNGINVVSVFHNTCVPGNLDTNGFATRVDFVTGAQPYGVEVRDIDDDGKPDLLVANSGDGTVSVLRNVGTVGILTTNSFAPRVDFVTGGGCDEVKAGDLDGDGLSDLVCVNSSANTVSLLRNLSFPGTIAFAQKIDLSVPNEPLRVAIGDLDGDGKLDLTVTAYLPGTVSVFRNIGSVGSLTTNSFANRVEFGLGGRGHTPALGDLNGDGKPDLAVVTELSSLLSIFQNTSAAGTFTNSSLAARVDLTAGYNAWGVSVGDLDGDGRPDVVFCNQYDSTLSIYRNQTPLAGPPVIVTQPASVTLTSGGMAIFQIYASGSVPLIYQWFFNQTNLLAGATNSILVLTNIQFNDAGNYSVLITNLYGITNSLGAQLTVNQSPTCEPPPVGLVAWWRAEGNAEDSVSNGVGVAYPGVVYVSGLVAQAFSFDGIGGCVMNTNTPPLTNIQNNFTMEFWAYPHSSIALLPEGSYGTFGQSYAIFPDWGGGDGKAGAGISLGTNGVSVIEHADGYMPSVLTYTNSLTGWVHVAVVYSNLQPTLYINGVFAKTGAVSSRAYVYPSKNLGMDNSSSIWQTYGFFNGLLDEVSIYNRALSAGEIAAIYSAGGSGKCVNPVAPTITDQPTNQAVSAGRSVAFSVAARGTQPLAYQWSFNGTNLPGKIDAILTLDKVQLAQAGNYSVLITNAYGSILSSNALLTVYSLPTNVPVILNFSPLSSVSGSNVNIAGLNFDPVPSNNIVYFGAVKAVVVAASSTNLIATVPAGATYAAITETVNGLTASSAQWFLPTFLGDGSAISASSFGSRQDLPAGNNAYRAVIADIDGDGKPDMVVVNGGDSTISIFQNISSNGVLTALSFASPVVLAGPSGSLLMTVADVDGDGKLDIVVSGNGANVVSVFRNICTAGSISSNSFAARLDFATGAQPYGVDVHDVDGDGRLDLLVANSGEGTISVLRNIGTAGTMTTNSFAPKVDFIAGSGCDDIKAADLDGDGFSDLVCVNPGDNTVSVLRNMSFPGTITFAPKADLVTPNGPQRVAIGDLDGDGKLDLAVTAYWPQSVSVFRNTSTIGSLTTNSFALSIDFGLGGRGHTPCLGDLNGDGKPDLAVVTEISSLLSIFQNIGSPGSFTNSSLAARVDFSAGYNAWGVSIGDLDGDGRPDVVFCNQYDSTLSIYQNQVPFSGPPTITMQPTNQAVALGGSATFGVAAGGSRPLGYQWYFNTNNMIASATNATLILNDVQDTNAGSFNVVISNVFGSVTSSVARLVVIDPPIIGTQPVNQTNAAGTTATFTVSVNGTAPFSYRWLKNSLAMTDGGNVSGSMTATLTLASVSLADMANYRVIVTNAAGSVTSVVASLTVLTSPSITTQPLSRTNFASTTATLTMSATGSLPLSYQWYFNTNTPITGATNSTLILTNVQVSQAGTYAVLVTNLYGAAWSSNALLTVNPLPTNVPVIFNFSPRSAVVGTSVTITGTNFDLMPSNNTVYFGAVRAPVVSASGTNLIVIVPAGAIYAPVTETVNGMTAYSGPMFLPTFPGNGAAINSSSFGARQAMTAGNNAYRAVIADMDGDGKPDLVVVNGGDNTISIFHNISTNGALTSASFDPPVALTGPPGSMMVTVADVDGDGQLDVIVTGNGANVVSVFRNVCTPGNITTNGFAARVDFATGAQPFGVDVRDVDGDGKPDLLVANSGVGTISILRNTSMPGNLTTNSFAPKADFATASGCSEIRTADLDGDGLADVVCANSSANTVSVLHNTSSVGTISFAARADLTTQSGPQRLAVGDVDGDGKLDLIVTEYLPQMVSVFRNRSTNGTLVPSSFAPRIDFSLGGRGHTPALGDFNGDGKPDLAVVTEINSLFSVFQNVSTAGSFTNSSLNSRIDFSTGYNAWGLSIGDLDGDGRPDAVFCNQYDSTISLYRNVIPSKPYIILQPTNITMVAGATGGFAANAFGPGPIAYQWYFNQTNLLAGATNAALILTNTQFSQSGYYSVVVTNLYGFVTSSNALLTVQSPPILLAQPTNLTANVGSTAVLVVSATGSSPLGYQWCLNGTNNPLATATNATLVLTNVQLANAGIYAVIVTNPFGMTVSSNATLTVVDVLDHFTWNTIPSPRFAGASFNVTVQAMDPVGQVFTNFVGSISLSTTNGAPVNPAASGNFVQGIWSGALAVSVTGSNLVLQASDGAGHIGLANPINVLNLPSVAMAQSSGTLLLFWPDDPFGFSLESSTNLLQWAPLTTPPLHIGNQYLETLPTSGTNQFYRLHYTLP